MAKKLVLSLVSCLLALAAAEAAVRLFDLAPEVSIIQKGRFRLAAASAGRAPTRCSSRVPSTAPSATASSPRR
ncbi:MAG TPA: hypothetical protein VGC93_02435, partial [Thermoanaerobaculia bacterium]